MKTTIVLIRHGEVEYRFNENGQKLVYGADTPLSEIGRQQTVELASHMKKACIHLERLYTSPYLRTLETSQILLHELSVESTIEERFHDIYAPGYVGMTMDELLSFSGDIYGRPPRTPDQETFEHMVQRVTSAVHEIIEKHKGETIGIVSHGDELRVLTFCLTHPDEAMPPYKELVKSDYMKKGEAFCITIDPETHSVEQQLIGRDREQISSGRTPEAEDLTVLKH